MSQNRTPLRYPGGKQRLAPFIAEIISENQLEGCSYVEPYAGGAGVAVDLLLSDKVGSIHLNDSSKALYSFWRSILTKTDEFCARISGASLTIPEWKRQREILSRLKEFDQLDVGFSFFFLNRCNRSGIPNAGVIGGLNQTGEWKIDARFPRNELIRRIEAIATKKQLITVKNLDAEKFIATYIPTLPKESLVYCDPPYYHKADRLYANHYVAKDHSRIAKVIQTSIVHPWIVSYDPAPEILNFYGERKSFVYDLQYSASRAYKGSEVFIFSDDLKIPSRSELRFIDRALTA
jgi:DNA adenine methylase